MKLRVNVEFKRLITCNKYYGTDIWFGCKLDILRESVFRLQPF